MINTPEKIRHIIIFGNFPSLKTNLSERLSILATVYTECIAYDANGRREGKRGGEEGAPLPQHLGPAVGEAISVKMLSTRLVADLDDSMFAKLASMERQRR